MKLTSTEKLAIELIKTYSDEEGFVYSRCYEKIMDYMDLSYRHFKRTMKNLIDNQIIFIHRKGSGRGQKTVYRLTEEWRK